MLLNVLMVNTAVVEMGVHNSRDEEQRCSSIFSFDKWNFSVQK